jgi:predicted GIY-YIG superfamily endonuclease
MIYYIYKLKCLNSDDFYIGKTNNIKNRISLHTFLCKTSQRNLYQKLRENGFDYEILDETDSKEKSCELERYYYEIYEPTLNSNFPNRKIQEYGRDFYAKNKDEILAIRKEFYIKNRELIKSKQLLKYYQKKKKEETIKFKQLKKYREKMEKLETFIKNCNIVISFD